MPRHSRRRFLQATAALLATGLVGRHGRAESPARPRPGDAAGKGRRFLASPVDPALGLMPQSRGAQVSWLSHDNSLAAKVLDRTEPVPAGEIRDAIRGFGVRGSGKIEILLGAATEPLPFRHDRLLDVRRRGGEVIETEVVGDKIHADGREDTDLLFLAAVAGGASGPGRGRGARRGGPGDLGGTGSRDRVNCEGGLYATDKLALAPIAVAGLGRHPETGPAIVARLLAVQGEGGGFVTDHVAQGGPVGQANAETTSLAVLALDGRVGS